MKLAMWRASLLMLCVLAALLTIAAGIDYFGIAGSTPWAGNPGATLGASSEPYRALVHTADPGGPAARAGLHPGDGVDVRSNTLLERLQLFNGFPTTINGRPVTLLAHRGARQERVTIVPVAWDPARYWYFFVSFASYVSVSNGECVSQNDPLLIALRAWNEPVDLRDIKNTGLRGEVAFPMVSRGMLVGVLVCGPKRDGQSFAPDESDALLALARGVGTAVDTLSSPSEGAMEPLRDTLSMIVEKLEAIQGKLSGQSLPPTAL